MSEAPWRHRVAPLLVALSAWQSATPAHASGPPGTPPGTVPTRPAGAACPTSAAGLAAASRHPRAGDATFRERVGADGSLLGYDVRLRSAAGTSTLLALPAESFLAGPFGPLALVGSDDGRRSWLHVHDLRTGCAALFASSTDITRRATLTPDGSILWLRLRRADRRDEGIWRSRDANVPERIVPPLDPDGPPPPFGPTFSTTLSWALDGALVMQSCGALHCRTRIVQPDSGRVRRFDAPGQGELVEVRAGWLVAFAACRGYPCPVIGIPLTGGPTVVLDAASRPAPTSEVRP